MNKLKILLLSLICLFPLAMSAGKTVYFQNSENWDVVKIHYWNDGWHTTWPGVECTNISGTNIYYAVIGDDITGMLFNSRGDDDKSGNVTGTDIVDGHLYHYTGKNQVPTHEPYTESGNDYPELYLVGSFNNWQFEEQYKLQNNNTNTYTLTLTEFGLDEFKIAHKGWDFDYSKGCFVNLNAEAAPIRKMNENMKLTAHATNVTFTFVYESNSNGTFKVDGDEGEDAQKVYTFYVENTGNWAAVKAHIWNGSTALHVWNADASTLTSEININGNNYLIGYFKMIAGWEFGMKLHNGEGAETGDLTFENNGLYNTSGAKIGEHQEAVIFDILREDGDVYIDRDKKTITGEANGSFTIKVNTTEHHAIHYAYTLSSPQEAPARVAAEDLDYKVAADGKITLPINTTKLYIATHDGVSRSGASEFEVTVGPTTGIEDITVEGNEAVEYYNLQGVRVANPSNGLYIVRRGNTATKQYIR